MGYAQISDIAIHGLPLQALGTLTAQQQQGALDAGAAIMDGYFRGRYTLPFTTFGIDLIMYNVWITQWLLMNLRGYAPQAGADKNIENRYNAAIAWLEKVRDQKIHPNVVSATTLQNDQPIVNSNNPAASNPGNQTVNIQGGNVQSNTTAVGPFIPRFSGRI